MADATYDVVIIGGGNKGLVLAMYLTKYGKMDVALFEKRYEAGGGWSSEEVIAPGFVSSLHMYLGGPDRHFGPLVEDFDWGEKGGEFYLPPATVAAIFKEDHSCLVVYSLESDPTGERTAKEYARFSERDAETFLQLRQKADKFWHPAALEWFYNPPPLPGNPDAIDKLRARADSGINPQWFVMSPMEAARDIYESAEARKLPLRLGLSAGFEPDMCGLGFNYAQRVKHCQILGGIVGGTHNLAHAAYKIILENGGRLFNDSAVDKIIIANGKARGIQLEDGSQVEARKAVVSTLSPHQLCFKLIGRENISPLIARKVENLCTNLTTITWYTWGFHEPPRYKAADFNPDINQAMWVWMTNKDEESLVKYSLGRRLGMLPPIAGETSLTAGGNIPNLAPKGKHVFLTETFVVSATAMTEKEWLDYHEKHAKQEIEWWSEYAPNINWENVIGYNPNTPYTVANRLTNMAPHGNWAVVDNIPSQMGRFRPIPELARHKVPEIEGLYCTGTAWHPLAYGGAGQGYNCYKIMAEDYGLEKPWEDKKRPW